MIPVTFRAEPARFCHDVRLKGLRALACQIGLEPPIPLAGPRPGLVLSKERVAEVRALAPDALAVQLPTILREIPTKKLAAHWRDCLDTLYRVYGGICAYLGIQIWLSTGVATVDHFIAKDVAPWLAYEWSNFRLSAHLVNTLKNIGAHLDPFHIEDAWFVLDPLQLGEVIPNPMLLDEDQDVYDAVDHTIETLHLNEQPFVADRCTYIEWSKDPAKVACVRDCAPFVYREAVRQGWAASLPPEECCR